MTKKHFQQLAEALSVERPGIHWDANKKVQWELDVKAIVRACRSSNPRFDAQRFITACGGLFE
jgi:hypothetical protein